MKKEDIRKEYFKLRIKGLCEKAIEQMERNVSDYEIKETS